MTEFTGQVNPTGTIHTPPPSVPAVNRLTAGQIGAFGTIVVDLILAQVAFALGGVNILGVQPFAFLTDWGNALVKQAEDAYKNSFVIVDVVAQNPVGTTTTGTLNSVYSAAAAVRNTATTASENADTANGNVQTTWNALWDGAKGTTGSTAKTASDVKAAVLDVRNTGIAADGKAQDTIDGVYSAVMGGEYTGLPANYIKPALTGLTYTARNNVATGSNLVVDPGGDYAGYWTGQAGVAQNTNASYAHTGSNSVSLTSAGATARTLFFNTIDTGVVQSYFVRQSEIYYVECWVYSATAMGTVRLVAKVNGSTITTITSTSMSAGTWIKLSGQYTIPVGVNTASFGIQLETGETTGGSVVYVDDMLVREITNAQTAQTNVESTWNQIYNGVYNLSLTGRSLTDVFNALYATKQTADGGLAAGTTAQGTAETAQGTAETAQGTAEAAAQDAADAAAAAAAADEAAAAAANKANNLETTLTQGYTVVPATSTSTWTKPPGITDLWVVLFGAGGNGGNGGTTALGATVGGGAGAGGSAGAVIATQLDPTAVPSTVTVTVGTAASPITSFGSVVSTSSAYAAFVATPLGMLPTASAPSAGGRGGAFAQFASANGATAATTAAGVAGGAGGSGAGSFARAGDGGGGSAGLNFGLARTGGSGGGGGGSASSGTPTPYTGGNGGNGGAPGGGGGGGGDGATSGGTGGAGANGLALIVYKIAKTTV